MRFDKINFTPMAMIVHLFPADEGEEKKLKEFRDGVANEIGLRLPGHDEYRFHISLGYTRIVPEGEYEVRMNQMIKRMDEYLSKQDAFEITKPYMAFYDDMLEFSPVRVPRD